MKIVTYMYYMSDGIFDIMEVYSSLYGVEKTYTIMKTNIWFTTVA